MQWFLFWSIIRYVINDILEACSHIWVFSEKYLYLGSLEAATDAILLEAHNITHIVTVDSIPLPRKMTSLLPRIALLFLQVKFILYRYPWKYSVFYGCNFPFLLNIFCFFRSLIFQMKICYLILIQPMILSMTVLKGKVVHVWFIAFGVVLDRPLLQQLI